MFYKSKNAPKTKKKHDTGHCGKGYQLIIRDAKHNLVGHRR